MNLQHCQVAARKSNSKRPQTHVVPNLTYIADPFFSLKERKLRTDEKQDTSSSKLILPISLLRPQSARQHNSSTTIIRPLSAPNKQRTAVDISKLHRKSDQEREIRDKIKNLFSTRQEEEEEFSDSEYDSDEKEEEEYMHMYDDSDSDIDDMSKQKQMELTEKILREKVERLKQERIQLENSYNTNKYIFTSTKLIEKELNELKKKTQNENESDSEIENDNASINSIM
eukprot:416755_1